MDKKWKIYGLIGLGAGVVIGAAVATTLVLAKKRGQNEDLEIPEDAENEAILVDLDGDGEADAILEDLDGDGNIDTVIVDTTGDGEADTVLADLDGDGELDVVYTENPELLSALEEAENADAPEEAPAE